MCIRDSFTDLPDVTESYFMSHTGDYDQDTIYMLSKSTDASYKFMEYVDGAWKLSLIHI